MICKPPVRIQPILGAENPLPADVVSAVLWFFGTDVWNLPLEPDTATQNCSRDLLFSLLGGAGAAAPPALPLPGAASAAAQPCPAPSQREGQLRRRSGDLPGKAGGMLGDEAHESAVARKLAVYVTRQGGKQSSEESIRRSAAPRFSPSNPQRQAECKDM